MAEWSKALDLGSSPSVGVGSNPTSVTLLPSNGGLAQSVECVLCKHEAPGSKPGFSTSFGTLGGHLGRVVKAVDSKSTGLRPRRFESSRCRLRRFSIVVIAPAL